MINFSTLQDLTIPDGVVTKITDASGMVLWSAEKPATITISFTRSGNGSFGAIAAVIVDGVTYPAGENESAPPTEELIVPIGTIITCKVGGMHTSVVSNAKVTLNGTTVASGNTEYLYTVVGDATIHSSMGATYNPSAGGVVSYGIIDITEK